LIVGLCLGREPPNHKYIQPQIQAQHNHPTLLKALDKFLRCNVQCTPICLHITLPLINAAQIGTTVKKAVANDDNDGGYDHYDAGRHFVFYAYRVSGNCHSHARR